MAPTSCGSQRAIALTSMRGMLALDNSVHTSIPVSSASKIMQLANALKGVQQKVKHSPFGKNQMQLPQPPPLIQNKPPTPINADRLAVWLEGYDTAKKDYLVNGFRHGFYVGFDGVTNNLTPQNLKSALDMPE